MYTVKNVLRLKQPINNPHFQLISKKHGDIKNRLKYSWSTDGVCWSGDFVDYKKYCDITKYLDTDYYLRILITSKYELPIAYVDGVEVSYVSTLYSPFPFSSDACAESECFDMYEGWDCAILMQQALADAVVCTVGIPIIYFKVDPQIDTADYNFKEYIMHSVTEVKKLKMVITDGVMPSSKPMLTEWDFEFEVDWEVELSRSQFATAFGDEAIPMARDFIWVPLQKRMYEVNSAYDEKNEGFMWTSTTWKLALVKYNEKTNVEMEDDISEMINNLIINSERDVFSSLEETEQKATEVNSLASPMYSANTLYNTSTSDHIRKLVTTDSINITQQQINHGSIICAKNLYEFGVDSVVEYQDTFTGNNGTIIGIFTTPSTNLVFTEPRTIIEVGYMDVTYNEGVVAMGDHSVTLQPSTTYLLLAKWSESLMVHDLYIFEHTLPNGVTSATARSSQYKFNVSEPVYNGTQIYYDSLRCVSDVDVRLYGYPLNFNSFKLYNIYVEDMKETFKYTTNNKSCVINDIARPLNGDWGYAVR